MSIVYNTSTVKDGLVLHLDAANVKSYPGSGSTWYDVSGKGLHWTLVNSPTYGNGYIRFDGISQYAERSSLFQSADNTSNTFSVWFRPLSTPVGNRPIWSDASGPELGVWRGAANDVRSYVYGGSVSTVVNNGDWVNVAFTYFSPAANSGLTYQHSTYINGVLIEQDRSATVGNGLHDMPLNIARDPGNTTWLSNIDVSVWQHYNRRLSDAEVKQNFNALRGRYGL